MQIKWNWLKYDLIPSQWHQLQRGNYYIWIKIPNSKVLFQIWGGLNALQLSVQRPELNLINLGKHGERLTMFSCDLYNPRTISWTGWEACCYYVELYYTLHSKTLTRGSSTPLLVWWVVSICFCNLLNPVYNMIKFYDDWSWNFVKINWTFKHLR